MVVPNHLLVVLPVVPLLHLGIPRLRGILLLLWGILLLREIFSSADRLVGVEWVVTPAAFQVPRLVGRAYLVLALISGWLRHQRCGALDVLFVG